MGASWLNSDETNQGECSIYLTVDEWEYRAVLVQEGKAVEYFVERKGSFSTVGNIYLGRVKNVRQGLSSAFVNIGLEKNTFLTSERLIFDSENKHELAPEKRIENNDEIIVQVVRAPKDRKGARVSTSISLPGRYLVLFPEADFVATSRKLSNDKKDELFHLLKSLKPKNFGVIIRTQAATVNQAMIEKELDYLLEVWHSIKALARRKKAPQLLYKELDLPLKIARDLLSTDIREYVIEDRISYQQVVSYLTKWAPDLVKKIKLYEGKQPLFEKEGIEKDLEKLKNKVVWLKSGGCLVIDRTEALTAIDVNSAKNINGKDLEETAFITNLEAAVEIPRQIRLRDIGGIIVIDFIDMTDEDRKAKVEEVLRKNLEKDRSNVSVFRMSPIGLVEMTRKSISGHMFEYFEQTCPECGGKGFILPDETISISFLRNLKKILSCSSSESFLIKVSPRIQKLMDKEYFEDFCAVVAKSGKSVKLIQDDTLKESEFEVVFSGSQEEMEKLV